MTETTYSHKSYFELSKHNFAQIFTFVLLLVVGIALVFIILFPLLEQFFVKFLSGAVYNQGEKVSYMLDSKANPQTTHYFFSWAVDVYKGTPQESK